MPVAKTKKKKAAVKRRSVDSRRIKVLSKKPFVPKDPCLISTLPTEIINEILKAAIDTTRSPIDQQWLQLYQAFVCRDWYLLRKERRKLVFISVKQVENMKRMINAGEFDASLVRELVIDFSSEMNEGKVLAIQQIILLCPRIERLSVETTLPGKPVPMSRNFSYYYSLSALKLDLKSFKCSTGMHGNDLITSIACWQNITELSIRFHVRGFYRSVFSPVPFAGSLTSLTIEGLAYSYELLEWLNGGKNTLKHLNISMSITESNKAQWLAALSVIAPHLLTLVLKVSSSVPNLDLSSILLLATNLETLSFDHNLVPDLSFPDSTPSMTKLTIRSIPPYNKFDLLLDEIEQKLLPRTFATSIALDVIARMYEGATYDTGRSIFATAKAKNIKLSLSQENRIYEEDY